MLGVRKDLSRTLDNRHTTRLRANTAACRYRYMSVYVYLQVTESVQLGGRLLCGERMSQREGYEFKI